MSKNTPFNAKEGERNPKSSFTHQQRVAAGYLPCMCPFPLTTKAWRQAGGQQYWPCCAGETLTFREAQKGEDLHSIKV